MKTFIIVLIISLSLTNSAFAYKNYEWGKVEFKKGNYAKANELFKNELAENPENLKCRYIYAQSFVGINNLAKAQKEYEKVIEQSPNSELAKLSSIAISKIHGYYLEKTQMPLKTKPSKVINIPVKAAPATKSNPPVINDKNTQSLPNYIKPPG